MKLKNKSVKIITIGDLDILPDEIVEVDEAVANNPVVKLFTENGFFAVIPDMAADEVAETAESLAEKVGKLKKAEVMEELKKLNIGFDENERVADLRQRLLEAMI